MEEGRPLLFPDKINERVRDRQFSLSFADASDPLLQYFYLNVIKNSGGEHNASASSVWYRRHLQRARRLLREAQGILLDVGCDDPALSRRVFPSAVDYVGLEPGLGPRSEFCLAAMAEFLPLRSQCLDGVAFMTSLDHILDHHAALDEAFRVLRPGGKLYLYNAESGPHEPN